MCCLYPSPIIQRSENFTEHGSENSIRDIRWIGKLWNANFKIQYSCCTSQLIETYKGFALDWAKIDKIDKGTTLKTNHIKDTVDNSWLLREENSLSFEDMATGKVLVPW